MMLLQMNPQTGKQQMENFTETQVEKLWFYYVFVRITIFHGIAVKWFLKVYWLLPLSTDDSFAENRRFFCWEPTILLLRTDDSFAENRRLFCRAPTTLLLSTDDSFAEHHEYLGQIGSKRKKQAYSSLTHRRPRHRYRCLVNPWETIVLANLIQYPF